MPDGFTFSIKASQRITHHARLKDTEDMMSYLLRVCTALGDKRGPTLFQLPPNMKLDLGGLAAFLPLIPKRWKAAIEFRHATWYTDDVYALLRQHEVALVTAESEDTEAVVAATAPYGYLRLHKPAYTPAELDTWAAHDQGPALGRGLDLLQARQRHRRPRARRRVRRALRLTAMPSVRLATPADAALLATVARRTFFDAYSGTDSSADLQIHMDRHFGVPQQAAELADPATTTLILEDDDGNAIGYTLLGDGPGTAVRHRTSAAADPALLRRPGVEGKGRGTAAHGRCRCRGAPARTGRPSGCSRGSRTSGRTPSIESADSSRWESRPISSVTPMEQDVAMARPTAP